LLYGSREKLYDTLNIVVRGCCDTARCTAFYAFVSKHILAAFFFYTHRLHHTITLLGAITRAHINMARPQTSRAVIGITIALHVKPAFFAIEIFARSLKFFFFRHYFQL
jgi:hypothetical protein